MLPPNLMAYWVARRQTGIPLSDAEKEMEKEDAELMIGMLDAAPKFYAWAVLAGIVLAVFIIIVFL